MVQTAITQHAKIVLVAWAFIFTPESPYKYRLCSPNLRSGPKRKSAQMASGRLTILPCIPLLSIEQTLRIARTREAKGGQYGFVSGVLGALFALQGQIPVTDSADFSKDKQIAAITATVQIRNQRKKI